MYTGFGVADHPKALLPPDVIDVTSSAWKDRIGSDEIHRVAMPAAAAGAHAHPQQFLIAQLLVRPATASMARSVDQDAFAVLAGVAVAAGGLGRSRWSRCRLRDGLLMGTLWTSRQTSGNRSPAWPAP